MSNIVMNSDGFNVAATCKKVENDKGGYILAVFPRTRWILFKNHNYYEDVETTSNEENEFYKSIHMIPKYHIHQNNKKVSMALPRLDKAGKPYLFIPKGLINKPQLVMTKRDKYKYSLTKEYYVFDVDDEYNINDNANIFF